MSDFHVRAVAEGEQRACLEVLVHSLHGKPVSDEFWSAMAPSWPAAGKFARIARGPPRGPRAASAR